MVNIMAAQVALRRGADNIYIFQPDFAVGVNLGIARVFVEADEAGIALTSVGVMAGIAGGFVSFNVFSVSAEALVTQNAPPQVALIAKGIGELALRMPILQVVILIKQMLVDGAMWPPGTTGVIVTVTIGTTDDAPDIVG